MVNWLTSLKTDSVKRNDFLLELTASGTTVLGAYLGSTTLSGGLVYMGSMLFWVWLMLRRQMWGLLPLNVCMTVVSAVNIYKALAA